jgi:hypothetical protein
MVTFIFKVWNHSIGYELQHRFYDWGNAQDSVLSVSVKSFWNAVKFKQLYALCKEVIMLFDVPFQGTPWIGFCSCVAEISILLVCGTASLGDWCTFLRQFGGLIFRWDCWRQDHNTVSKKWGSSHVVVCRHVPEGLRFHTFWMQELFFYLNGFTP